MASDALSGPPSETNLIPLSAAPRMDSSPRTDSTIVGTCRTRMERTIRASAARTISKPSPAWLASDAGPLLSALPRAPKKPLPRSAAGTVAYRLTTTPIANCTISITSMPKVCPRSRNRSRADMPGVASPTAVVM